MRLKPKLSLIIGIVLVLVTLAVLGISKYGTKYFGIKTNNSGSTANTQNSDPVNSDEEDAPPPAVTATTQDLSTAPADTSGLGGYNVLIADRGNNRIIEVTPDKKIVWEYHFKLPKLGLGADDAFFTDGGKTIIVNLEEYHVIEMIDYATKQVIWTYGTPGVPGHLDGQLNTPDDAYKLPNGNVIVADIKNCRVIEITPDKQIAHQFGQTRQCSNTDGYLNIPNGDTPLPDGHILISNIVGRNLIELDQNWQQVFTMPLPVTYPSDPQMTKAGNILISDYSNPGQIVETGKDGNIVWHFDGQAGDVKLDRPSLAIELPNGNILSNDDFNHRVIVIDKATKKIIWQYGVTHKPGSGAGQLSVPDGVDIIRHTDQNVLKLPTIGAVTRHAANFIGKTVEFSGYLREQHPGYAIFSDELTGPIGSFDLPVIGAALSNMIAGQKYLLQGVFEDGGLAASNGNPNHLELLP